MSKAERAARAAAAAAAAAEGASETEAADIDLELGRDEADETEVAPKSIAPAKSKEEVAAQNAAVRAGHAAEDVQARAAELQNEATQVTLEIADLEAEHEAIGDPLEAARAIGQKIHDNTQLSLEFVRNVNLENAGLMSQKLAMEVKANREILPRKTVIENRLKFLRARAEELHVGALI